MRFGLAAHRRHREGHDAAMLRWARSCGAMMEDLDIRLLAVGGAHDALQREGLLEGRMESLGDGRDGGLMRLAARVVATTDEAGVAGVFFFVDPTDPSSTYPEAMALKRQCIVHGKPFVSTEAGAQEWVTVEAHGAGVHAIAVGAGIEHECVALIAHDARKNDMLAFANAHFNLLSHFARRVATGTTGRLLNDLAVTRGWPAGRHWVDCQRSGPMGGDAQIAEMVLDRRCARVIFFEDPHVTRQHEADIQLLDRAVSTASDHVVCFHTPEMARRWAASASVERQW